VKENIYSRVFICFRRHTLKPDEEKELGAVSKIFREDEFENTDVFSWFGN